VGHGEGGLKVELFKEFSFEAAHRLPAVSADHKCARLHGHSYRLIVRVSGSVDSLSGMVMDFADVKAAVKPLIDEHLDHYFLNEVEGLENPTSENLARWVWDRLIGSLPQLSAIEVRETCTSGVLYRGEYE
jgi:6-pyruvoyltetrahydropterin/6-carboxytetrahydropterin synthase